MLQACLRRIPRPSAVQTCSTCAAALGMNYAICPSCHAAIEQYWLADWHAFLAAESIDPRSEDARLLARVVLDEGERHPWSVLDVAMTRLTCPLCGNELGGGPTDCAECAGAWGVTLWAETVAGRNGLVTMNEHALHVGRLILRHPHRQSASIIAAWSRTMPRLLTGWLPSTGEAQHMMALVKAGRLAEVDAELAQLDQRLNTAST